MRQWKPHLTAIGQNIAANAVWGLLPAAVGVVIALWGIASSLPGPMIFVLVLYGLAALTILYGGALWVIRQRRMLAGVGVSTASEHGTKPSVAAQSERPAFQPFSLSSKVMTITFGGLWQVDSYVELYVNVMNTSPNRVTITGTDGHMYCGGTECSLAARMMNAPRELTLQGRYYDCLIRQPLTEGMAREFVAKTKRLSLTGETSRVGFNLGGLKWMGVVQFSDGEPMPLPGNLVVGEEVFYVLGPIQQGDQSVVQRLELMLASQEHYRGDGSPR